MDHSMTIKVIGGIIALLIVLRVLGKKELSQLTPVDLVYLLVLGGFLEESTYDDTVTVWQVIYVIFLWGIIIYLIELLIRKFDKLRPIIKGKPSIIIRDGKLDLDAVKKNKLESEQLRSILRQQGIFSIKEVKYAILEPGGQMSILPQESSSPVTPSTFNIENPKPTPFTYLLVDEGRIHKKTLEKLEKDGHWLRDELRKDGHLDIKRIFYAEWSKEDGLNVIEYDD